ncbi:MAG: hypothetical protein JO258_12275 [Alphaproteobacteria bacterium]|nr:hypothetical protein [Alphaproteobacteria bacterium]
MPDGSALPPTSAAATRRTEPEIVAGISSGEGQPAGFAYDSGGAAASPALILFGAAMAAGLLAGFGLFRNRRS